MVDYFIEITYIPPCADMGSDLQVTCQMCLGDK